MNIKMKEDPGSVFRGQKKHLILVIVLLFSLLVGCNNVELENDLYNSKTSIEDVKKIDTILMSLEYPKDYKYSSFEIRDKKDPISLNVYLEEEVPNNNRTFERDATTIFSLVSDINSISFISEKRGEILYSSTREDIDKYLMKNYKLDTKTIGENKENFNNYLKIKKVK